MCRLDIPYSPQHINRGACVVSQGEIRVTGFNQEVDKFFSLIEAGKVRLSSRWWVSTSWLSARTVFHCPVKGRFGCRLFQEQLPVLCELKPQRPRMSYLATLYAHNKQLMIICQPLLIPSMTVWSRILFAPFSQVKCSPDLWLTCGSSICTGQVYYISKCSLKIANKQYTSVKNDYEMTLNGESSIIPCDDSGDVPMVQCDFIPIGDLESRDKDAIVGESHGFPNPSG